MACTFFGGEHTYALLRMFNAYLVMCADFRSDSQSDAVADPVVDADAGT